VIGDERRAVEAVDRRPNGAGEAVAATSRRARHEIVVMIEARGMSQADAEYVVRDNPDELRYEILRGGELLGEIRYQSKPGVITLVQTEVTPAGEGQGVGSRLVAGALDDIRARGLRLVPVCPFVRAYLRRHPEQRDLVRL
jgi:predicted GNAT family acetyltransferase